MICLAGQEALRRAGGVGRDVLAATGTGVCRR
jgi:hypothetical protein